MNNVKRLDLLTDDELHELTGFKQFNKQVNWLSENGYKFQIKMNQNKINISRKHIDSVLNRKENDR